MHGVDLAFPEQVIHQRVHHLVGIQGPVNLGGPASLVCRLVDPNPAQRVEVPGPVGPFRMAVGFPRRGADEREVDQNPGAPEAQCELPVDAPSGQPPSQILLEVPRETAGNPPRLHHQTCELPHIFDVREDLVHEPSEQVLQQPSAHLVDPPLRRHPTQEVADRVQPGGEGPGIVGRRRVGRGTRVVDVEPKEGPVVPDPAPDDIDLALLQPGCGQFPRVPQQTPERVVQAVVRFQLLFL